VLLDSNTADDQVGMS